MRLAGSGIAAAAGALLLAACGEDPIAKLERAYAYAGEQSDHDRQCAIADQALDLLTERADRSLDGQMAYNQWEQRKIECDLEALRGGV